MNMESSSENTQECSVKIDTIWSEADESLLIKEEIVSDLEPDCVASGQEDTGSCAENHIENQFDDEESCNSQYDTQVLSDWQPSKKKMKSKNQKAEENKIIINHKLACLHDTKNFKIVKRRLRCGDCRSLVCPECCKVMIPNLQSHFLGSGVCNSGTYLCKLCSIIFHSLCALQAHIRIHTMDTPYVCPDCGLMYNNMYFLILHLLNKCYHVYKIVRYKCKQCPGMYFTPENFIQHIQEAHIHCVFRCLYCSSLFNNYDEFNYHMENIHQKQKVQYLNYFRCSLCSNMVIPRFMYQKHVAQHRENSEYYEVDYQCLCGETYGLIGAFRSHFSYCNKKGVLPPKWSFLQKKLKAQDMFHQENLHDKEVVIQPLPVYSAKPDYKNLTSSKSDNNNSTLEEEIGDNVEIFVRTNCGGFGETPVRSTNSEIEGKDSCNKEDEKSEDKIISCNNYKGDQESLNKCKTSVSATGEVIQSGESSGDKGSIENNKNVDEIHNDKNKTKESEQNDGGMSKIYDHIPCDHLGYLIKAQFHEQNKKTYDEDDIIVEKNFSPENYKFVTQLDEKTGVITTKTVPLDDFELEEDDNINEDDYDSEDLNFSVTAKQLCNEKTKFKVNGSLSCPFCIVLFPKHSLTFQQFRLHLESYHPDAALNITINSAEEQTPGTNGNLTTETKNKEGENLKENVENYAIVKLKKVESPKPLNSEPKTSPKKDKNQTPKKNLLQSSESKEMKADSRKRLENEKENFEESKKHRANDVGKENENVEPENCTQVDLSCEGKKSDTESTKDLLAENINKESNTNDEKFENDCSESFTESTVNNEGGKNVEEKREKPAEQDSGEKTPQKTISDLDYEGETSKDSNWSGMSGKDARTNSPETKLEERERSRRESEVWSELYESLMLAEKLKKRKNPSPDSDSKKNSVVSDYSSKRVVKKPKRYRESSESGDSNEFSESDEDFLLESELMEKICPEEKGEDQTNKKQMLMNKLENVDGKFVDYLIDLVTKKEKVLELYKKHSALRANRYSHDLRSYRKKVLNGIKQRGRPIKIVRHHELMKKEAADEEKNGKESYQLKKKSELSPESKTNERKRGRPRKYHEAAKLKERRRSDKEVDFIEKNFEREENDMSPSKRKRKLSSKLQYYRKMSDEKDDFSSGQLISNKPIDSNKKFTCAVCKEVFPGLTEFRVHIVVHRMEENTYQCMECGECFVVRPSLEKHLHAFHKIKNIEKYISDNQCCSIKKEIVEVDEVPLKENQCKVCKDQFDRPIDLTKHFRIHGMAFLKEFRKEGKSTEKRNVQGGSTAPP